MPEPLTREEIALLESFVQDVLARETTASDLPRLRWALARQQALLEAAYDAVGQNPGGTGNAAAGRGPGRPGLVRRTLAAPIGTICAPTPSTRLEVPREDFDPSLALISAKSFVRNEAKHGEAFSSLETSLNRLKNFQPPLLTDILCLICSLQVRTRRSIRTYQTPLGRVSSVPAWRHPTAPHAARAAHPRLLHRPPLFASA